MRFRLILEVNRKAFGDILPINYQYEQSATIYKILSRADKNYSAWLHENGYRMENGKTFKFFSYSRFNIEKYKILHKEKRIRIISNTIEWQISFLPEKGTQNFIQGIFINQVFEIGDRKSTVQFIVRNIEVMPVPEFTEKMTFQTLSPICLKLRKAGNKIDYLSPEDSISPYILFKGLIDKYNLFYQTKNNFHIEDCQMEVIGHPKSTLIKVKAGTPQETSVRGFMCKLKISAPIELMKFLYESAAGSLSSMGFGFLKILNDNLTQVY